MANVVPTLYYDIIARICPGAAFYFITYVSALYHVKHPASSPAELLSTIDDVALLTSQHVLLLAIFSYIVGMVLSGLSLPWDLFSFWLFKRRCLRKKLGLEPEDKNPEDKNKDDYKNKMGLFDQWEHIAKRMECVGKNSVHTRGVVTKALAEVMLCQNLLSACLLIAGFGFVSRVMQNA